MTKSIFEKRREYVNEKFGKAVAGTNMPNSKKTRLMKKFWKEAKKKYPK